METAEVRDKLRHLTWRLMETYRVAKLVADDGKTCLPFNLFLYYDRRSMCN